MESFSSIVSLTYARRRQASSPLQTSCSTKHELNGVFFEHCVPDIRSQATSLIFIADRLLHEAQTQWSLFSSIVSQTQWSLFSSIVSLTYARRRQASSPLQTGCFTKHKLNGVFFEHYVPDIRSQATSLISIADKLLLEAQTQWSLFRVLCPRHMLAGDKPHLH
ncbi:unnamed protein product [Prunus armeniaca]